MLSNLWFVGSNGPICMFLLVKVTSTAYKKNFDEQNEKNGENKRQKIAATTIVDQRSIFTLICSIICIKTKNIVFTF